MTSLWENAAGFALAPLVLWLLAAGYGLLLERATRVRLSTPLLVPVGFCASVIIALAGYETGVGDALSVPVVAAPAVVGLVLSWRELPARLNSGWPLIAAAATFVLFDLSVIASGHWTWTGYNIENDSAYELVLIAHLQAHGTHITFGPASTAQTVVTGYLSTGYPLGSQSLLAVLSGFFGVPAAALWQGFISTVAAVGTMAASSLSGRTFAPRVAAAVGFVAVSGALVYQYALQGAIKEIAVLVAVLSALAVGREAILRHHRPAVMIIVAIPLAAILAIFNAAGLPYVGALIGAGSVAMLLIRRQRPRRGWLGPSALGVVVLAILAIPALITIGTFFNVVTTGYGASHPAAPALGPLARKLPLTEMSGVWLYGDYRFPVPGGTEGLVTVIATVLIFSLVIPGLWRMWHAREVGPAIGLAAIGLVFVVVYPRVVPYAQAKLLMIATPIVLLAGLQAISGLRKRGVNAIAVLVGLFIAGTVLSSDALAYRAFPVAPVDRLLALRQVGQNVEGQVSVLDSEFEQFAKYFMLPAAVIDGPDAPTPEALALRTPATEYDRSFDLNQETLPFVESFSYIVTRRSPVTSPPPANFRLRFANSYYELWKRQASPHVYAHLPFGGIGVNADSRAGCGLIQALDRTAPRRARWAEEVLPVAYGYRLSSAAHRAHDWVPSRSIPGGYVTYPAGEASKMVHLPKTGRYRIWVQGDFPRTINVMLDGRQVGSVRGSDTPGGWLSPGVISIQDGTHDLAVVRPAGDLAPGSANTQAEIDGVALSDADTSPRLLFVPLARWRTLCSARADWVELVGP